MRNNVSRIIVDTNLWVSFLITHDFEKLDQIIFSKRGVLVFSQELLDEFLDVVRRPKFKSFFSSSDIEAVLATIHKHADFVPVRTKIHVCRDFKDNFLLSLSVDGKADFLLTGDQDLLQLAQFNKTEIMTISEFLKKK